MGRVYLGMGLVLLGSIGFGLMPLFARLAYADGLSPLSLGTLRFALAVLLCVPMLGVWRGRARQVLAAVATGAMLAAATLFYFIALTRLSVAQTALIFFTFPLFAVLLGRMFFHQRLNAQALVSAGLVALASALIVAPGALPPELYPVVGLAFLAPLGYALFLQIAAHQLSEAPLGLRVSGVFVGALLMMAGGALVLEGGVSLPAGSGGWIGVVGIACVSSLGGIGLTVLGAPMAGPARTAVAGSGELVTALSVGAIWFDESFTPTMLVGAALILVAIIVSAWPRPGPLEQLQAD